MWATGIDNFSSIKLQQCLPLAVLKLDTSWSSSIIDYTTLQQCLPLAVLKLHNSRVIHIEYDGCNSAYRLRYATKGARQQRSDDETRTSLVPDRREGKTKVIKQQCLSLTVYGIET